MLGVLLIVYSVCTIVFLLSSLEKLLVHMYGVVYEPHLHPTMIIARHGDCVLGARRWSVKNYLYSIKSLSINKYILACENILIRRAVNYWFAFFVSLYVTLLCSAPVICTYADQAKVHSVSSFVFRVTKTIVRLSLKRSATRADTWRGRWPWTTLERFRLGAGIFCRGG